MALMGKCFSNRSSLKLVAGFWRFISNNAANNLLIHGLPLTRPIPWIPSPVYANSVTGHHKETQVTVLENGIQVASEPKFGQFCTVGVLIDSGSRYEIFHPSGISHFLERLAFSSTSTFPSRDSILRKLKEHSGICNCQSSRDTLIYSVSARTNGLPFAVDLLSEVVLRLQVTDEEIKNCRTALGLERESIRVRPNPEPLLVEMIHSAAYPEHTLGLPKICPLENLGSIDRNAVLSYLHNYHTLERMVIAGVGVEHSELVSLANQYFNKHPTWMDTSLDFERRKDRNVSAAQYRGGIVKVKKDVSYANPGSGRIPELVHVVIGLESCSHSDPDFVPFSVLNAMMGGGGDGGLYSTGCPRKGRRHTRLYLNMLNRFEWIHGATACNHIYRDSGLFCMHASTEPKNRRELVKAVVRELVGAQFNITESELRRAKTRLQSLLLMSLETQSVHFEDLGRQVLSSGRRLRPQHYYHLIEKVTRSDIESVVHRMLQTNPSVAAFGDVKRLPRFDEIQTAVNGGNGRILQRFSIFQ